MSPVVQSSSPVQWSSPANTDTRSHLYCSQWERTSFSAVAAPAKDLNAQTMDCSIWLAFIRLVTKPRLSEQSAVCTRTQTCILSNRRNTFFDHHFRLAPLCGHNEYQQTISSRSGLYFMGLADALFCTFFSSSSSSSSQSKFKFVHQNTRDNSF